MSDEQLINIDNDEAADETVSASSEVATPAATSSASEASSAEAEEEKEDEVGSPENQLNMTLSPEQQALPWYVVNTYSGFELYAKKSLLERVKSRGLETRFGNVLVPQETVVELVRGKKKTSTRKFFPGYMLVQMDLDDETWHIVSDTPKVTGFVGDTRSPMPISKEEVESLTQQMAGAQTRARPRVSFEEGDTVKVIDGPFKEFNATVEEVNTDKGRLRVLISIFGRNTPVELDFVQVEKS